MFRMILVAFTFLFAFGLEGVTCAGYSDFGASYIWFNVPEANAIVRGTGGEVTTLSPRGGIDTDECGWGVMAALGFQWSGCSMGELRGFYSQNEEGSDSTTALSSNSLLFYEITGNGNFYTTAADYGVSALELKIYGGDALFICDFFCTDCNRISWAAGLSYKRLEQNHRFYGTFQGAKVTNFSVEDELSTDYIGLAAGIRGEVFFTSCMAFFLSGDLDFYYANDCLTSNQIVSASNDFTMDLSHDEFAIYGEGKMGMMFINGCFTLGVHGFYGAFSYAPQVVYPLSADAGAVHLACDTLTRYGAELTVGLRF